MSSYILIDIAGRVYCGYNRFSYYIHEAIKYSCEEDAKNVENSFKVAVKKIHISFSIIKIDYE